MRILASSVAAVLAARQLKSTSPRLLDGVLPSCLLDGRPAERILVQRLPAPRCSVWRLRFDDLRIDDAGRQIRFAKPDLADPV